MTVRSMAEEAAHFVGPGGSVDIERETRVWTQDSSFRDMPGELFPPASPIS